MLSALASRVTVRVGAPGDVNLYHIGNNGYHREIYRTALDRPGVVILHDAVLHHFLLGTLEEKEYVEEFVFNYGEWHRELAQELWMNRARSGADPRYFRYPMLKRIAERSRAVIVHNPAAAAIVRRHAPNACVVEIPHLYDPPDPPALNEVADLRDRLGVRPGRLLFGVFGHLRESKRLANVLKAFEKAEGCSLLVAGDFVSSEYEQAIAPEIQRLNVIRTDYLPEHDFWVHAAAVDVCINLRYPAAGETSGIAVRLMGTGKCVMLSEGEEVSRFPADTCLRVDPGPAESDLLAHYMTWLMRNPEIAKSIGQRAQAHIAEEHALGRVADLVLKALIDRR
jgi:glycosyltransferase involved in cell wall biosynthesis